MQGLYAHDPFTASGLVPLPPGLVPVGGGAPGAPAAAPGGAPGALERLAELERFLAQCEEPGYASTYQGLLDGSPAGTLSDFAARLRARAVWLESLEAKVAAGARGLALAPPLPAAVPQAPRGLAPDADVAPEFPPAPLAPPGDGAGAAFCSVASQLGLSALAPGDDGGAADFFGASPPRGASPLENRPLGPFGGELAASPRGARPGRARRAARR